MSDQCRTCTSWKRLGECLKTPCHKHHDFIFRALLEEVERWKEVAEKCAFAKTRNSACEILEAAEGNKGV